MKLIDADALIDEIKYFTGQDTIMRFYDRNIEREQEVNMAAFIELMPTIDPVKHGKWVAKDDGTIVCSLCGDFWGRADLALKYLRYCPNCGAKMDGGKG